VTAYVRLHPQLTREEILSVMMSAGPLRANVESELQRIAEARKQPARPRRVKG
jgi:hypothetical protein